MKELSIIGLLALLFVSFPNQIIAEERVIIVAATEWSPYMSENLPDQGVITETVRVAFEKAGYQAVF